jgi:hypothetical protein
MDNGIFMHDNEVCQIRGVKKINWVGLYSSSECHKSGKHDFVALWHIYYTHLRGAIYFTTSNIVLKYKIL